MTAARDFASSFARACVEGKFAEARTMLAPDLAAEWTEAALRKAYRAMILRTYLPVTRIDVMSIMDDWPDKEAGDEIWAYVALEGEGYAEAITVIVHSKDGFRSIRDLEFGRP